MRLQSFRAARLDDPGGVFAPRALEPCRLRVALEGEDVGGDAVEEPAVMGDHHGAAREIEQRVLERAQRVDVEIVRRLVEQQHVAAALQDLRQVDAVPLAAGELTDGLLLVAASEVEPRRVLARVDLPLAEQDDVLASGDLLPHRVLRVEVGPRLVDVGQLDGVADLQLARVRLLLARDHPEERRLPGAVRADHADDPGRRERERRSSTSRRSPKPFATFVASITRSPSRGPGGMWISTRSSRTSLLVGEQALVVLQARLRLRVARLRARPHPLQLARQGAAMRRLGLLLDREPRLLLLEPAGVVPLVRDAAPAVELEDPAGDVVEEVPVMRHGDDGALVVVQEPLEPVHRLRVEVVRRLVEQQQIGGLEEQPAERHAPPLAARERRHVPVAVGQAERVHRVVEMGLELPRVAPVDLVLHGRLLGEQRIEVGVGLGEQGRDRVEPVEQVAELADPVLDVLAHRPGRVELGLLLEQAHRRPGREVGDTGRRLLLAGHDPQQRRLARPVRPEHADLRPGQERERDVGEDLPVGAVELVRPVHREDVFTHYEAATIPSSIPDPGGVAFGT